MPAYVDDADVPTPEPDQPKPKTERVTLEFRVDTLSDLFELVKRCQAAVPGGVLSQDVDVSNVYTTLRGTKIKSIRLSYPTPDWTRKVQWTPPTEP